MIYMFLNSFLTLFLNNFHVAGCSSPQSLAAKAGTVTAGPLSEPASLLQRDSLAQPPPLLPVASNA
jgi:hypothetical protein